MKKIDETIKSYVEWVKVGKEEYEEAKEQLSKEEFSKMYRFQIGSGILDKDAYQKAIYPTADDIKYMVAVDTLEEMRALRRENAEIKENTKTIKFVAIFFAVLTAVSLILSIALVATTVDSAERARSTVSRYLR